MMVLSSIIRAIGLPSEHPLICEVIPARYRATAIGIFNTCGSAAGGVGVLLAGIFKQGSRSQRHLRRLVLHLCRRRHPDAARVLVFSSVPTSPARRNATDCHHDT
jgi:hypothetical protein